MAAAEHTSDDFGVKRAAASRDPGDGVDQALDIADAFLEQVADSFGVLPDQVDGVLLFVVLREDQHTGLGALAAHLDRRAQTVVSFPGRHVYVGDHDRRPVREALAQEIRGVAGLSNHIEPRVDEQPRDALTQQHVVFADHHPDRI